MIVHSLDNVRPPARFLVPPTPWTGVRIEQSEAAPGPWTTADTQAFATVDLDPAQPGLRDISFASTLTVGYFRLAFLDAAGNESPPTAPVYDDGSSTDVSWAPTVEDAGRLLRARTKDSNGTEIGTFNANTRPTGTAVQLLIAQAIGDVRALLGSTVPVAVEGAAKFAATLRTAMLIELSYFPEQVRGDHSAYSEYKALYDGVMDGLLPDSSGGTDGGVGGALAANVLPSYFFPEDTGGLIGWGTKF